MVGIQTFQLLLEEFYAFGIIQREGSVNYIFLLGVIF